MPYLGIIRLEFEKNIIRFEVSALEFVLLQILVQKLKSFNLTPKMLDLGIFGMEFENKTVIFEICPSNFKNLLLLVVFEINSLEFGKLQNFMKNKNT